MFLNITPAGRWLSEGSISVGQAGNFGFPLKNLCSDASCLTSPKIQNSFIRYNKFGQKVYDSTNKLTLSATKPEIILEKTVNGETTQKIIDTSEFLG